MVAAVEVDAIRLQELSDVDGFNSWWHYGNTVMNMKMLPMKVTSTRMWSQ
jgi:hypothetical protein